MRIRTILSVLILFPILGCGAIGWGWFDYEDSRTALDEPRAVELADLESGPPQGNTHVRVGEHAACYYAAVYTYHQSKRSRTKPDANTTISECYYPIVSASNPAVKKIQELEQQYGSLDKVPDDVDIDPPAQFAVVVKTTRYKKVGDIPNTGIRTEPQVQGLLLKRVSALGYKEKKLLQESFPNMKMDNVLVLEEGRRPSSAWWCFTRVGLGVFSILLGPVLALIGVVMAFRNR